MDPARNQDTERPVALHDQAADNLRYIRRAMENAGSFTAVPGWGVVGMGIIGLSATLSTLGQPRPVWLAIWLSAAALAVLVGGATMVRKAKRFGVPLLRGPGRKFALSLSPPMFAGAVLTWVLFRADATTLIPGVWLLLYGAGIATGGAFSTRAVPIMGLAFMATGVVALFTPPALASVWLGIGFGGLHVIFGVAIARRYGG